MLSRSGRTFHAIPMGRCDGPDIERRARRGRGGSGALACRWVQRGRGDQRHRERLRRGKTHPWAPVEAGQLYGEAAPAKAIPPEAVATIGGKAALKWKEWRAGFKQVSVLEPKPPTSASRPLQTFAARCNAMPKARCLATPEPMGLTRPRAGQECPGDCQRRRKIAVAFLAAFLMTNLPTVPIAASRPGRRMS